MDVVNACRAFVWVSDRGSFTLGAAAARIPQSVASRRIAALERHLGERLFDRSTRTPTLTPFGRDLLPSAERLVRLADAMEQDAERAKRAPFRLAVPDCCPAPELARLAAEARRHGVRLDLQPAGPAARLELLRSREVRAALRSVAPGDGRWRVPLGLAGRRAPRTRVLLVETLRAGREGPRAGREGPPAHSSPAGARIWLQPEDDVPHVRDPLTRVTETVGLQPAQLVRAPSLVGAAAEVLSSADLLLASARQAAEFGLSWRPIGEVTLVRGYALAAGAPGDADRLGELLSDELARCLGVPEDGHGPGVPEGRHGPRVPEISVPGISQGPRMPEDGPRMPEDGPPMPVDGPGMPVAGPRAPGDDGHGSGAPVNGGQGG